MDRAPYDAEMKGRFGEVRDDFIPAGDYISPDFLALEYQRLWPNVWQIACREEGLAKVGDHITYEIGGQSLIVTRAADDQFKAYHNVCLHRGRRLVDRRGRTKRFHCRFHGWQWNLDGTNARTLDPQDWEGCPAMAADDLRLREARVDRWGGFVFVNMNPDAEPLAEFLAPMPEFLDCFEFDRMRYRWSVSVKVPCNWKTGIEAFVEGYHVYATHPQWPQFLNDSTRSAVYGKHGMFGYPNEEPLGQPSPRLGVPRLADVRENLISFYDDLNTTLAALYSERATEAVRRLRTEVPADAPYEMILGEMYRFIREACEACGAGWPDIGFEQMARAGTGWFMFPNIAFLMQPDAAIFYRTRPDGDDPNSAIFDIWSLQRYAPGAEPPLKPQVYHGHDDWRRIGDVSPVLLQDFSNMEAVQLGMKSWGFPGCRPNPMQESAVSNSHKILRDYLFGVAGQRDPRIA